MDEKKEPHERIPDKHNGLSSTQEVIYPTDFKKADEAYQEVKEEE